jgi:membrane protease YdiL (CAAX protease family)
MSSTGTDQHRVLSPHGPPSRFERGFMPLIVFAIVAGVVGIALDILQDLSGFAVGVFQLGALGPLAGAVAAWLFFRATLREILPAAVSRRQATAHLILGLAAGVLLVVVLFATLALLDAVPTLAADVHGVPVAITLVGLIVAAAVQEVGIRGLAQPILELTGSRLFASLVVGVLWGLWVVQLFPIENTPIAITAMVLAVVALAILLGYLGNGSVRQRLSVTIPVHAIAAVALILASGAGVPSEMVALAFLAATGSTALIFIAMFVAAQRKRAARAALADGQPAEA